MTELPKVRRICAYLRQSSARAGEDARSSLSLTAQDEAFRAAVIQHGWTVVGEPIRDHDESGKDPERPGLIELRERVAAMKPDAVWVLDLSRFARDFLLQEQVYREFRASGTTIISHMEPWLTDEFVRQILGAVSSKYLRDLSVKIAGAHAANARRGHHHGRVPLGYTRIDGFLVPDETTADAVRDLFARFVAGESSRALARAFGMKEQTVRWMLRNPVYAGHIRYNGELVTEDAHAPLVSAQTFSAAQARWPRETIVRAKEHGSWLESHVRHSCGARMTLNMISRPGGARYPSFRCIGFSKTPERCREPRQHASVALLEMAVHDCLSHDLAHVATTASAIARATRAAGGAPAVRARVRLDKREADAETAYRKARALYMQTTDPVDLVWVTEQKAIRDAELAAVAVERASLPAAPDASRYTETAAKLASVGSAIDAADGDTLGKIMALLGTAMVGAEGVRLVYWPEIAPFIPSPACVDWLAYSERPEARHRSGMC